LALGDPQVRIFFALVIFTFVGTLAQDVLLEPYGALVLGMPVAETTRLTMYWGLGVMAAMLLSGLVLMRWLGHLRLMQAGIVASILVFAGLIVTGVTGNAAAFKGLTFVMGLGTGMAGAGMLAGVISFTTAIRAGMLMGLWGVANMTGHAFGSLMGGVIVDVVRGLLGSPLVAYAAVFGLEIVMLLAALALSFRLDFSASRAAQEEQLELKAALAASAD
ncbi:MAG: PucC family protein, partial [Chloroflexota bacterium]